MKRRTWLPILVAMVAIALLLADRKFSKRPLTESFYRRANSLLDAVNEPPEALKEGSKQRWLEAFHENATMQDPTGSQTHRGLKQLEHFHDALIGHHRVRFAVKRDFVDEEANRVTRVCDIHIYFFNNTRGYGQIVHAQVEYDIDPKEFKIVALHANWDVFQSNAMGDNMWDKVVTMPLVTVGFVPLVWRLGVGFTSQYIYNLFIVGPWQSGGSVILEELVGATLVNNKQRLGELFGENSTLQLGNTVYESTDAVDQLWEKWGCVPTLDFRFLRTPVTSGLRTSVWYQRTTAQFEVKEGVFHIESHKPHWPLQPSASAAEITSMYLFEPLN